MRFSGKLVRGLKVIFFILIFTLFLPACDIARFLPASETSSEEAYPAPPTLTDTPIVPTPSNTSTVTQTPTKTIILSATIKPTLRPTWTVVVPTMRPTWTASPTLSPTATPELGILIEDDFSDPNATWIQRGGANWNTFIIHEAYYMRVQVPNVEITSARSWLKLAEVRIEADIGHNNGNGYYGFSCRETVAGHYYTIFVTTDGYYGFGELDEGKVNFFEVHPMPKLAIPFDGKGENHIRADCRGDSLTLFVNGEPVDRYTVPGLGPGWVGMMVGTRPDDGRLVVYFDNLKIYSPLLP
jgi:hypothetical protein